MHQNDDHRVEPAKQSTYHRNPFHAARFQKRTRSHWFARGVSRWFVGRPMLRSYQVSAPHLLEEYQVDCEAIGSYPQGPRSRDWVVLDQLPLRGVRTAAAPRRASFLSTLQA